MRAVVIFYSIVANNPDLPSFEIPMARQRHTPRDLPSADDSGGTPSAAGPTSPPPAPQDWNPTASAATATPAATPPTVLQQSLTKSGITPAMVELRGHLRQRLARPQAFATAQAANPSLLGQKNIVGHGFGMKWSDGRPTGERAVVILVHTKADPDELVKELQIPPSETIRGEKVLYDVQAVGHPRIHQGGFQTYQKPARYGDSVGLDGGPTGTYGCRVRRFLSDGSVQTCLLSNNHVLADVNRAPNGATIVQPGPADSAGFQRPIAELVDSVPLNLDPNGVGSAPNRVDAAIGWTARVQCFPDFRIELNFDPTPVVPYVGMAVAKEGRTTGYTTGTLQLIDVEVNVGYDPSPTIGSFNGQLQIIGTFGPFSSPGDSGSLVCGLVDGTYHPIGLLFSGDGMYTWANQIQEVMDALNISVIDYDPNETLD
jgi:hypothetical protein